MPTLYITRENGILGRKGDALCWRSRQGQEGPARTIPLGQVEDVVVLGQGNVTTQALHALMDADVPVHYVDAGGRYKGSLTSGRGKGYSVRKLQYAAADEPDVRLALARNFIAGKLLGQRRTLLYYLYRRKLPALRAACSELERLAKAVSRQKDIEALRGIEGFGASEYFAALSGIFQPPWFFGERNRRPPRDPVNALLSFGYTLLLGSVTTAAIMAGLDPCVGFIHPEYRGRPSLPLDMMEEFRSPIIDRMVISSCNQDIFKPKDFERTENGGIVMSASAKKALLEIYDNRLRTAVRNDSIGERAAYETHLRSQAVMLVRRLRGHSEYLPFICAN
jgi:CRISPR-associated protein Cas1